MKASEAREDVKLLGHWASPFVTRVRVALNLKRIQYEFLEEETGSKGELIKSELLLNLNPVYKKIPVLVHGGKPVCESMIIIQYIDDVWASTGPSILPSDPYDRALARFWTDYLEDKWFPLLFALSRAETEEVKKKTLEQTIAGLHFLEEAFKECSKGKCFFGGDTVGYLDIVLGCSLGWIGVIDEWRGIKLLDEAKTPQLVAWAEKFCSDDAVTGVMPEHHKLMQRGNIMRAQWTT